MGPTGHGLHSSTLDRHQAPVKEWVPGQAGVHRDAGELVRTLTANLPARCYWASARMLTANDWALSLI